MFTTTPNRHRCPSFAAALTTLLAALPANASPAEQPASPAPPVSANASPAEQPASPAPPVPQRVDDAEPVDQTAVVGGEYRRVNEHNFIMPVDFPSALANSQVGLASGFGVLEFEGLSFFEALEGNEESKISRVFFYSLGIDGQIGIANRVGVEIRVLGTAAVSGDVEDLLGYGAFASVSAGAFPKVRIWTFDDIGLQLACGVGIEYSHGLNARPASAVLAAIDAVQNGQTMSQLTSRLADAGDIVVQVKELSVAPALLVAEGVGPFGAQLALQPHLEVFEKTTFEDTETPAGHTFGTGTQLELDIANLTPDFPVAFTAAYANRIPLGEGEVEHTISGGIYYSGRRDLALGTVVSHQPGAQWTVTVAQIGIQYFF